MANPLEQRWCELWEAVGAKGNPLLVFARLRQDYSEPHRAYHNLQHIEACLDSLTEVEKQAVSPSSIGLALWFHDAIYDTHRSDNEEQSAALLRKVAGEQGIPESISQASSELVLATKHHTANGHPDVPLIVDIDLKILGESQERFEQYEQQIRKEYEWVPAALFTEKRAEILERFLTRPFIYNTAFYQNRYEERARTNLVRSIQRLKKSPAE